MDERRDRSDLNGGRRDYDSGKYAAREINKLYWWLIGGLAALVVTFATYNVSDMRTQLQTIMSIETTRGERLAALEAKVANLELRLTGTEARLGLLEQRR